MHTNKDRALQPIPKGTVCLCAAKKVERVQQLGSGRVIEEAGEGEKKRMREGKNKRQGERKC